MKIVNHYYEVEFGAAKADASYQLPIRNGIVHLRTAQLASGVLGCWNLFKNGRRFLNLCYITKMLVIYISFNKNV